MRVSLLLPALEHLARRGGAVHTLLEELDIQEGALAAPDSMLPAQVVYDALDRIAEMLGDHQVGATVGVNMARAQGGPLGGSFRGALTIGDLFNRFLAAREAYGTSAHYRLDNDGRFAILRMQRTVQVERPAAQPDATGIGFFVETIRHLLGPAWDADRVLVLVADETMIPIWLLPPSSVLRSGQNGFTLRFPAEWLSMPMNGPGAPDLPSGSPVPMPPEPNAPIGFIRTFCAQNLEDPALCLEDAARACRMHPRKLQRVLKAQGTTFSDLIDALRRERAIDIVATTGRPITDVALEVGFTRPANFTRAFKRWTGVSPGAYRRERIGAVSASGLEARW